MDIGRIVEYDARTVDAEGQAAAVLVPIVRHAEQPHLLLTKRAESLPKHPGQMSFPGGRREPFDHDYRDTAIREANEEIGVRPDHIELVGRLDDITTTSNFIVTPVVARIPNRNYRPNDREVAEVTLIPIESFLDRSHYDHEFRERPNGDRYRVHYFHVDPYVVWGATARIVVQFLDLTTDWSLPDVPTDSID